MALVGLVMVAIAENARIPVDNPATHLELTMVHEAMILEYSGRHLAVIETRRVAQAAALSIHHRLRVHPVGRGRRRPGSCRLRRQSADLRAQAGGRRIPAGRLSRRRSPRCASSAFPDFLGAALMLALLAPLLLFVSRGV